MNYEQLFAPARKRPVRCALIGCGEFGLTLIAQARSIPGFDVVAVVDRDIEGTRTRLSEAGASFRLITSAQDLSAAITQGELALTDRIDAVLAEPVEMIVEATGHPEAGPRFALAAIEAGIGVAMVSKEAECCVGPLLAHKARSKGVPYTLIHGDQPALLIALISWCQMLGLPVVAAGKSSEYDYVYDPDKGTVNWTSQTGEVGDLQSIWNLGEENVGATLDARSKALADFPLRTVADFCEMALVANATGLKPDKPEFHAPLTRSIELPFIYRPAADGGVLQNNGEAILDVFNCLRRPDEASFAGGVFAIVRWADTTTGKVLRGKGIPTTTDGQYGLVYNPSHLLGVEAPMSVMAAARLGNTIADAEYRPVVDLTARAAADMPAGTRLDIVGNRHVIPGFEPQLTTARAVKDDAALPYYMAVGLTLVRDLKAGEVLSVDAVAKPQDSVLWDLRAEQDEMFATG